MIVKKKIVKHFNGYVNKSLINRKTLRMQNQINKIII